MNDLALHWNDNFAVGHKGLDAEHRRLVEIINGILVADHSLLTNDQLKVSVNTLTLATVEHFRHENAVLRLELRGKMASDAINEHLAEHARSLSELETILHAIMSENDGHDRARKLELKAWFLEHATGYDEHLKIALRQE